jgi:hypothetical protein
MRKCASTENFLPPRRTAFVSCPQTVDVSGENALRYGRCASGETIYGYVEGNPINLIDPEGLTSAKFPPGAHKPFGLGVCAAGAAKVTEALLSCEKECSACGDVLEEIKCRAKYSPDDQASARWKIICACQKLGGSKDDCIKDVFTKCIRAAI